MEQWGHHRITVQVNKCGVEKDENGGGLADAGLMVLDESGAIAKTIFGEELYWTTEVNVETTEKEDGTTAKTIFGEELYWTTEVNVEPTEKEDGTLEETEVVLITMIDADTLLQVTRTLEDDYKLKEGKKVVFELAANGDNLDKHLPMTITLTEANCRETETEDGEATHVYVSDAIHNLPAGDYTLKRQKIVK